MLSLVTEEAAVRERPNYRPYSVTVSAVQFLSPSFTRVTFSSGDLQYFGTAGLDQRIKVVFPLAGIGMSDFGATDEQTINDGTWYPRWRDLPDSVRNPIRTYTIRAVRPAVREIDIDFVAHGDGGPAAHWLLSVTPGDEVIIIGPDQRGVDPRGGIDWHPGSAHRVLLAGDETAAPAICSILESLPEGTTARAFIEVPSSADVLALTVPAGCEVTWLARDGGAHGSALDPAVRRWVGRHRDLLRPVVVGTPQPLADIDVDIDLLWDSPEETPGSTFYAWLAGEAGTIKALRRYLVTDTGIDRKRVAFMGYWRLGKAEGA
jgi:NADPH-dependent ferric siderophore reductase